MHKSSKLKNKLLDLGDPYDYKLADFTYTWTENWMEPH